MTVVEYNNQKNKILREHIGIDFDLIPDAMNVEIELTQQHVDTLSNKDSGHSCIYCIVYAFYSEYYYCKGCPMKVGKNLCTSDGQTFDRYVEHTFDKSKGRHSIHTDTTSPAYPEMVKLIKKFKAEYK